MIILVILFSGTHLHNIISNIKNYPRFLWNVAQHISYHYMYRKHRVIMLISPENHIFYGKVRKMGIDCGSYF